MIKYPVSLLTITIFTVMINNSTAVLEDFSDKNYNFNQIGTNPERKLDVMFDNRVQDDYDEDLNTIEVEEMFKEVQMELKENNIRYYTGVFLVLTLGSYNSALLPVLSTSVTALLRYLT